MSPTLKGTDWNNGDVVLTETVTLRLRRPRRWEVVVIRSAEHGVVMKRVVGLPGERIQVRRGGLAIIDGQPLTPPSSLSFLKYLPVGNLTQDQIVECGDGYYVLGDDTRDSDDSRFNGPTAIGLIFGRPWLILAPKARFGFVNP